MTHKRAHLIGDRTDQKMRIQELEEQITLNQNKKDQMCSDKKAIVEKLYQLQETAEQNQRDKESYL
jgi:uncharacterized coiled-coil protein SlyX